MNRPRSELITPSQPIIEGDDLNLPRKYWRLASLLERDFAKRPPIARRVSVRLAREWRKVARRRLAPGDRRAASQEFEDAISDEIRRRLSRHAKVSQRTQRRVKELLGIEFEADILLEPHRSTRRVISILSCKTTLATGELKQSIGEAYVLGKLARKRRRALRYYFVVTHRAHEEAEAIDMAMQVARRYVHGVYHLANEPFIDGLVRELRQRYS